MRERGRGGGGEGGAGGGGGGGEGAAQEDQVSQCCEGGEAPADRGATCGPDAAATAGSKQSGQKRWQYERRSLKRVYFVSVCVRALLVVLGAAALCVKVHGVFRNEREAIIGAVEILNASSNKRIH